MSTELPEIVRRAMIETVTDIGQLSNSETYQLNKYVKKGWLSRGKGGPFPILKTVYAHRDYDFESARQGYVNAAMAAYEIEKRLRASGYFDVSSPNCGVDLNKQQRKDDRQNEQQPTLWTSRPRGSTIKLSRGRDNRNSLARCASWHCDTSRRKGKNNVSLR